MSLCADTSLLVSYYVSDANSARAQALIHSATEPLMFTGLHRLEFRNAFALGVFRRLITASQARAAWADIERDLRAHRLRAVVVSWSPALRSAAQLSVQHSPAIGCRSLDVLHVATAKQLGVREFFSFDTRQRALAQRVGLAVKP